MALLAVVMASALVALASTEGPEMVWPKAKVNVSESYMPAVVQVLTYLMEEIYPLAPPPETTSSSSGTSEQTSSTTSDTASEPPASSEKPSSTLEHTTAELAESSSSTSAPSSVTTTSQSPSSSSTMELSSAPSSSSADSATTVTSATDSSETLTLNVTVEENQETTEESTTTTEVPAVHPSLAFVMLGRLRDVLANESKRQGFSKIQGFSPAVVETLVKSSYGTSVSQLRTLLCTMVDKHDAKRKDSISHAKSVLDHLNKPSSLLVKTLEMVPPLNYSVSK